VGLLVYQIGPWELAVMEAIRPLVRSAIGIGALASFMLALDHRRAAQAAQRIRDLELIDQIVRNRSARVTESADR